MNNKINISFFSLLLIPSLLLAADPATNPLASKKTAAHLVVLQSKQSAIQEATAPVAEIIELTPAALSAPRDLGPLKVLQANKQFIVVHEGKPTIVQQHNIDKTLRGISSDELKKFLIEDDGYVKVQRKSDGQFALEGQIPLHGGGIWGANIGCALGKLVVYGVGHGALYLAACATGPCFGATYPVLTSTFAGAIEVASHTGMAIGGILGATLTGPI